MSDPKAVFSEELQALLSCEQHPLAAQFREFVMRALKMQAECNGQQKNISFPPELLLEVAGEIDKLLTVIKALAEVIVKQTSSMDSNDQKPGKYLS